MNILKGIKKKIILIVINRVLCGTHFFELKRKLLNQCEGVLVGEGTKIVAPIHFPRLCRLEIGGNCWIGHDFTLEGNGETYIGNNCDLAPNVVCVTGSHVIGNSTRRAGEGFNGKIVIGNGVWIGTRVIILPDIEIGDSVVVGAAANVTQNLVSNGIYVGNPAKRIRDLD